MRVTDTRLTGDERTLLASMVGCELELFRCDEFRWLPTSYQAVGLAVGGGAYLIENLFRAVDYLGEVDDVA
jgi:hypothetical protein